MPEHVIAGRYVLEDLLGHGGMSEVWRARDRELGRRVAIKLLAPNADTARFEREARAVASLAHPNITQLYDYGRESGRPFMVLEYLPGGTLEERLRARGRLPDDEALAVASGMAAGLAHAHARGVVHRDLKPANVLFDEEGRPKLADFGIARLAAGGGTLTEAGTVLGTAAYISPEQAAGEPATAASDVYSFGVILYRLLTGRLPFESDDPMELVLLHRDGTPPPLLSVRPDAPEALAATAAAAIAKRPSERPADGAALLALLGLPAAVDAAAPTAVLAEDATRVLATPPPPEPPRRSRAPLLVALVLVALALGGGALAYALTRPSSPPGYSTTFTPVTLPSQHESTSTSTPATTGETRPATTAQTTSATTQQTTAPSTTATTQATTTTAPTVPTVPTGTSSTTATVPTFPTTTAVPTTTPPTTVAATTTAGTATGP